MGFFIPQEASKSSKFTIKLTNLKTETAMKILLNSGYRKSKKMGKMFTLKFVNSMK